MPEGPVSPDAPLAGKVVVLIHPAWVECGSHKVFASQARAYRALGATVTAIAMNDEPASRNSPRKARYVAKSADIVADRREWVAMRAQDMLDPSFARALFRRLRGDHASLRVAVADKTPEPDSVATLPRVDLIHCNHFFCMPMARRIARQTPAPIILDSHDVQSRQYKMYNDAGWTVPPTISYEAMLAVELAQMRHADLLVHLNDEEAATFRALLPDTRHAILYPAVDPVATGGDGRDILIVAAANYPNVLSIAWFLNEVFPRLPRLSIRIVGTIDAEARRRDPDLFKRHAALFFGPVADLSAAYRAAAVILLPTVSGHGISIKTIEALSTGIPLVATAHAFRGMQVDPTRLANVEITDDPAGFAAAIIACMNASPAQRQACEESDSRQLYERMFSNAAYSEGLYRLASPLIGSQKGLAPSMI